MPNSARKSWEKYKEEEIVRITDAMRGLGYALDLEQVHIGGERYLQSGQKLVLTGKDRYGKRVVIKGSSRPAGMREIEREHEQRTLLENLPFAYRTFESPRELAYGKRASIRYAVTEFIQEERGFLKYSTEEQFFLALKAFKEQEGAHATTAGHARAVRGKFGILSAEKYLADFGDFVRLSGSHDTLLRAHAFLSEHREIMDGYGGFLTHTDFVPHNFRIMDGKLYLLDHTSLAFANKYEGWARFLNFMTLYNPELEKYLSEYVRLNRSAEEYLALRLMRVYKLGFLVSYYASTLAKTEGNLRSLSEKRISFWLKAMDAILADTQLAQETVDLYKKERDALRSEEEMRRQRVLNQL